MKHISAAALCLLSSLWTGLHAADWKIHSTFDGEIKHLIDTRRNVYFTSRAIPSGSTYPDSHSLFRYDKEGDELTSLTTENGLSGNIVSDIAYCPEKGYLVAVYEDFDIDLIYDNGKIVNIPDYRLASLSYPKKINAITFSPGSDRIYLATDFGYVALNDKKHEIAESRVFGTPLSGVARLGDTLLVAAGGSLLKAPAGALSMADFSPAGDFSGVVGVYPLGEDRAALTCGGRLLTVTDASGNEIAGGRIEGAIRNVENNRAGITAGTSTHIYQIKSDGSHEVKNVAGADGRQVFSSYDMDEVWAAAPRRGLRSVRLRDGEASVTRDFFAPDAPSPFISAEMRVHPEYGLLTQNLGYVYGLTSIDGGPLLLSGYSSGGWSNYAPAYTNPAQAYTVCRPVGFAVDPDNPQYVYVSTVERGFARINMRDGEDIIHFSKPSDPSASLPGFVEFVPDQTGPNRWACRFSVPYFDRKGNLWMSYTDLDNQSPERLHLVCWKAADRKATASASELRPPVMVEVEGVRPTNIDEVVPLSVKGGGDWLLYCTRNSECRYMVIDTNGTPDDASDDRVSIINTLTDQDGNTVGSPNVRFLREDPSTGYVWAGYSGGVYYFNPADFMEGRNRVTRIKVARNDGTNLADYLLNEVPVYKMTTDGAGRKWFATGGAGLVGVSADNRTILSEITASEGGLPDNQVYCAEYLPETNSIMVSTASGMAEYFLPASSKGGGESTVRAYPNPVRPDYGGYVTIDGLHSDALVKIVDSGGNLVKEMRCGGNGEVKWDVTDLHFRKAGTGVYFVMASSSEPGDSFSEVAKILVVN